MRKIYLIRHGKPDFADDGKWCIGRTDLPLGEEGHLQSCLLGYELRKREITDVFCSSLKRSIETAALLADTSPIVWSGLEEQDMGVWDGLAFRTIKERWPKLYEARGRQPELLPPNAESREAAFERFRKAIEEILDNSQGDVAIVAHKSVIQLYLCQQLILPYASSTLLEYDGKVHLKSMGEVAHPFLTEELCEQMLQCIHVPENICNHCKAVAHKAGQIAEMLNRAGFQLDMNTIVCGAMLHDMARTYKKHAETGAGWLLNLGYEKIAEVVLQHNQLSDWQTINEAAVVYLADKYIQDDREVTIEKRFEKSYIKCKSPEAQAAHQKRYKMALQVQEQIIKACGGKRV